MIALLLAAAYAHGWVWLQQPNQDQLNHCRAEMERVAVESGLVELAPAALVNSLPYAVIAFNGSDSREHAFIFPGGVHTGRVETNRRPYDVAVQAELLVMRDCFGPEMLEIHSSGVWPDDFVEGSALYAKVFGRAAHNPLGPKTSHKALWWAAGIAAVLALLWTVTKRR